MGHYSIDSIVIRSEHEQTEFCFGEGGWCRSITSTEVSSDSAETTTVIGACSAEDVITALLLAIGQKGVEIYVKRGLFGTGMLIQSWGFAYEIHDTPLNWFEMTANLKIE